MKLEYFIASEVEQIMAFNAKWRELNKERPDTFPLEQTNPDLWKLQMSHWFSRLRLDKALKDDDVVRKTANANANTNSNAA